MCVGGNDKYYCFLRFDISLTDLDLDPRSQECEKAETSIISQSFHSIEMEFGILLRLVGVMNHILILSHPFNGQWREPNSYDFVQK